MRRNAEPGQFIILRIDEYGERVPFTIADFDREKGTVTIIVSNRRTKTTKDLAQVEERRKKILDFAGILLGKHLTPLWKGSKEGCGYRWRSWYSYSFIRRLRNFIILVPNVTVITGFRNKDLVILEDELKEVSNKLIVATDDGSNGNQGFVTDMLKKEIEAGEKFDEVIAIGPLVMMKFVCKLTEQYNIPTTVSMNPVMIDGTGMCGGCRVIVGGETKFACVDGPDFDGHKIDWDTAMKRGRMF